jgi:hypothetical protein
MGYSRSGSTSSLSSGTTLSPLTLSPVGSANPVYSIDNNTTGITSLASDSDFDSLPRIKPKWSTLGSSHTPDQNHDLKLESSRAVLPVSPNRSPTSEKSNPLRFYTPAAFVPRRETSPLDTTSVAIEDPVPDYQTNGVYSSEQHLASEHMDDIEKYGSTGSLNYPSAKLYQPYASVEVKHAKKRALTPPKPFVPSTWSARCSMDKMPMAMVDIDIDGEGNVLHHSNKMGHNGDASYDNSNRSQRVHPSVYILDNKLLKGRHQRHAGLPSLQLVAQKELESDV